MTEAQKYGIFLSEGDYGDGVYAFSFTDQELADWIQAPVEFPEGKSSMRVPVPGYEGEEVGITIGSAYNDKLIGLTTVSDGYPHRALLPTREQDNEDVAYDELLELVGGDEDRIFDGLIY